MSEVLEYEEHHIEAARGWAANQGAPEEVAKELIRLWNNPSYVEECTAHWSWPETPEFIEEMAKLIKFTREGIELKSVPNRAGDPLCDACNRCR